jgi:hypothetical protein
MGTKNFERKCLKINEKEKKVRDKFLENKYLGQRF